MVGAKIFLRPLRGATELVGFAQTVAIATAMAVGLFTGRHITIEFFVSRLPKRVQVTSNRLVSVLGFAFFVLLAWQSYLYGGSLKRAGEISSTAHIPLYPFAYVVAFSAAVASLFFLAELLRSFEGGTKSESG